MEAFRDDRRLRSAAGPPCVQAAVRVRISFSRDSVKPKFAPYGAQVCWPKERLVSDCYSEQRPVELRLPEDEEFVQFWKGGGQVVFLPDEFLEDRSVIGHSVEDVGRGETIASDLTLEVSRHHVAAPPFLCLR